MNYLKVSINYLFLLFLTIILFNNVSLQSNENKILFKINNKSFTTYDYEKRLNYLKFIGDNESIEKSVIVKDFISANIFYEYYLKSNKKINYNNQINDIYKNILDENLPTNNKIDEENIKYNLNLDLIRKNILEEILSENKKNIFDNNEEIDLLYKFYIKYINVELDTLNQFKNDFNNKKINTIEEVENYLLSKNIPYFKAEKEIIDINSINENLKKNILKNNNFFLLEKNNMISFIKVSKNFETFNGLIAKIYSLENNQKINISELNCDNINNSENNLFNLKIKEYEYNKLNQKIKDNLININDYLEFKNQNKYTYVILCGIKFDRDILYNLNINKKINTAVDFVEREFIQEYSKKYNLIILYE